MHAERLRLAHSTPTHPPSLPASPRLRGASDDDDDSDSLAGSSESGSGAQLVPQRSILDALLLAEWEDRAEQGLFRYDVTACPTKVVAGSYGFIAQCNEGRLSKKRPTEFRIDQVRDGPALWACPLRARATGRLGSRPLACGCC